MAAIIHGAGRFRLERRQQLRPGTTAGNWTPSGVPNSAATNVNITTANSVVTLDGSFTIGTLSLGGTDVLSFNNNSTLDVTGGAINNNGTISLNAGGNNTFLNLGASTTLSGTGTLLLSDSVNNQIRATKETGFTFFNQQSISAPAHSAMAAGLYAAQQLRHHHRDRAPTT